MSFTTNLPAQTLPVETRNPDEDWTKLVAPATPPAANGKKTAIQAREEKVQKAKAARETAVNANKFHVYHPTHANAAAAKKLEALAGLEGVTDGDTTHEAIALEVADKYRRDPANAAPDRFEVALLAERTQARARLGGVYANNPTELLLIAAKLRKEFGDIPDVFNFYASVARASDMATGKAIAQTLLQSSAPAEAKAEAQAILTRDFFIGKTISAPFKTLDGKDLDLARQEGKVTLLYIWSGRSPDALRILKPLQQSLPKDGQVFYFAPTATAEQLAGVSELAPIKGTFCTLPIPYAAALTAFLGVRQLPYVFAFGRDGKLAAYGPAEDIESLLALAAAR